MEARLLVLTLTSTQKENQFITEMLETIIEYHFLDLTST